MFCGTQLIVSGLLFTRLLSEGKEGKRRRTEIKTTKLRENDIRDVFP